jgi:hypothetical protein
MNIRAEIFGGGRAERQILRDKQPRRVDVKGLGDVAISREETRRSNNRNRDRYRLNGDMFRVGYDGRDYDAEVVNLSGGGAMIAADLLPNIGDCLQLHLGEGGAMECAVRWIKGGRLGLEFAHETQLQCPHDEQAALLRDVIQRVFPDETFGGVAEVPQLEEEQRSATRHPLIWSGELHYGSNSWRVRLRNISATGALLDCPGALRVGSEATLSLDKAGDVTAEVSWIVGDHVGLRFTELFDLRRLSQCKPQVTPAHWLRPAYLEKEVESGSAWDKSWGRMSVDELRNQLEGFLKR